MALYRGTTKVSGIGQSFNPENTGTEGQVLTKTNTGYSYQDAPKELPTTGNVGDVLTKTADGNEWAAPSSGLKQVLLGTIAQGTGYTAISVNGYNYIYAIIYNGNNNTPFTTPIIIRTADLTLDGAVNRMYTLALSDGATKNLYYKGTTLSNITWTTNNNVLYGYIYGIS